MEVAVSSSHVVSAAVSSSGEGLLTLCPCSSVGPLPWETILHYFSNASPSHGLQFFTNCSSVGPCHRVQSFRNRLLQCGSPTGSHALPANLLQRGSPRGRKPCQETCSSVGSSLHGSTSPGRILLQHGIPMGSQPPSGIHLLWRGVLHELQVEICSTMDLHGLQGHSLHHQGLLHGLQGNLCSDTCSTSSPPFALTFASAAELFFSHILTLLSCCKMLLSRGFFLLNYVIPEVLLLSLMVSALASSRSTLELAGTGSVGHGGSFWQLLTEASPVSPLLPKPCHTNPAQNLCNTPVYSWMLREPQKTWTCGFCPFLSSPRGISTPETHKTL